jgi:hypothetical protein
MLGYSSSQDVAFTVMLTLHKTISDFDEQYFTFEKVVLRSNTRFWFRAKVLLHIWLFKASHKSAIQKL